MKAAILAVLLLASGAAARSIDDELTLFEDFRQTYNRRYAPSEYTTRFECFRRILNLIDERNAKGEEVHGVNQFSDMCPEEFAKVYLGAKLPNNTKSHQIPHIKASAPTGSVDWRTKGAVTPVKNQGMCGSCWTFSATGNMEGQWKLSGHTLIGLSEEELVQCATNGDFGCQGGWMDNAFDYVASNGGIATEEEYPYTSGNGVTGNCNTAIAKKDKVAKFSGHIDLPNNEESMANWCEKNGPIAIAVDALTWQTYISGIMKNCLGSQLDHGVLIVGYDMAPPTPYWIIKNSWAASWGENGYIRVEYGTNQCNIKAKPCSAKNM